MSDTNDTTRNPMAIADAYALGYQAGLKQAMEIVLRFPAGTLPVDIFRAIKAELENGR